MLKNLLRSSHFTLTLLIFIAISLPMVEASSKKEKWYEVEIIIFTNQNKSIQDIENWPDKPGSPNTRKVTELFSPAEFFLNDVEKLPVYYVEPLESGENNLNYIEKKIKNSRDYSLILHRTWYQTATQKKKVAPVYLDDYLSDTLYQPLGNEEEDEEIGEISAEQLLLQALLEEEINFEQAIAPSSLIHPLDPIIPFDENVLPKSTTVPLSPIGPPNHALFGTFQLYKNRFLHVAIDFLYRTASNENNIELTPLDSVFPMEMEVQDETQETLFNEEQMMKSDDILALNAQEKPPSIGYRHSASKRIRLKEIHYFDHPVFGVIVRVIRYVEPEPDEEKLQQISSR